VAEGRGQMPAWQGTLSPEEIDQIWAYVRSRVDGR
jgi:mono/diheme cytochrome c family protein